MLPEECIGVLVTYQPDDAVVTRIKGHLSQLSHVIVIDNGAASPADCLPKNKQITLIAHPENNLAAAQNTGICAARARGAKAVLLLDDDSEMGDAMLAKLCAAYTQGDGLIAPQLMEAGAPTKQVVPWLYFLFKRQIAPLSGSFTPIASGSLIPISVLDQVGLMDESFNIDYVDRDFCLRLLQRGYRTKAIAEAELHHHIGATQTHAGLAIRNHSPARRRSIFRNRLRCWTRYGLCFPSFLIYDVMAALYDLARIAAFEDEKRAKFAAIGKGVLDAIRR